MPQLVDYHGRYALLQEAVFEIVLTQGVHALSRRAVARRLEVSANTIHRAVHKDVDLMMVAVNEVELRRRRAKVRRPRDEQPRDTVFRTISEFVPRTPQRAEEELVWLRLALSAEQSEELARHVAADHAALMDTLDAVVRHLEVPASQHDVAIEDLHVVVDGLTWAVCTGRLEPERTAVVLERAIDRWTQEPVRPSPPGPP